MQENPEEKTESRLLLMENDIYDGKPRFSQLEVSMGFKNNETFRFDRKLCHKFGATGEKNLRNRSSKKQENDFIEQPTISSTDGVLQEELVNLDRIRDRFGRRELLLNIMSDLTAQTVVCMGDVKLNEVESALKLNEYHEDK